MLRVVPARESKGLRSQESEAAQQFKYLEDLCAELELAVLGGNTREVKCQRRVLTSGLRQAEEAIVRTAEAHRWTKAALDRALDDVRGRALPQREEADHFQGRATRPGGSRSPHARHSTSPLWQLRLGKERCWCGGARGRQAPVISEHSGRKTSHEHTHWLG
jgi:hypothetical protein